MSPRLARGNHTGGNQPCQRNRSPMGLVLTLILPVRPFAWVRKMGSGSSPQTGPPTISLALADLKVRISQGDSVSSRKRLTLRGLGL